MTTDYSKDFNFITDRLAIGCLASRSTPGFVAVVSVVTVEGRHRGRPWSAELTARARPQVAPADVFKEAIARWLGLDKLATTGPRQ